jgi:hypothetical protein
MVTQPKDEQLKINAQTEVATSGRAPKVLCTHVPWHSRHKNQSRERGIRHQSRAVDTHCRCTTGAMGKVLEL